MKNTFIGGLVGLSLLGACQEGAKKDHNIKLSDLTDTLQMNSDSIRKEYEKVGSRGTITKKNETIIKSVVVHEGTVYPEIEQAMLEAATYNMEYKKDTINGDSITARGEKFLDMPAGCFFMLELINNKWVTYQDLLNAANNHDISGLASKVFKREYPEGPLTLEQEAQKREDKKIFIRMALYVCLSDTYDAADEQIHWIQETRGE